MHDDDCHDEHAGIATSIETLAAKVTAVEQTLEFHVGEIHDDVMGRQEVRTSLEAFTVTLKEHSKALAAVTESLAGPVSPLTGERREEVGIAHKVDVLWRQSQNGGIKTKLSATDRAAIYGAIALYLLRELGIAPDLSTLGTMILGLFS